MGPIPQRVVMAGNSQCWARGEMGRLGVWGRIGMVSPTGQLDRKIGILCLTNVFMIGVFLLSYRHSLHQSLV